jgi:hypothetical protein
LAETPDEPQLIYRQIAYMLSMGRYKEALQSLEVALSTHYEHHTLLYEFFEDLEVQKALFRLIQQYKE